MYCGHNRMALLSQQQIAEAMMRLLEDEFFDNISVSDLCKAAQVSRQTFYSLFESKENVLIYKLSREYCYEPEEDTGDSDCHATLREICQNYSRYIVSHQKLLTILAKNNIMHCLYDSQYEAFLHCPSMLQPVPESEREYAADYYASVLTALARTYVTRGAVETEDELTQIMERLMSGCYLHSLH